MWLCSSAGAEGSGLDEDTLSRLVEVLSVGDVPWRKLAEKLGMMTLTHLYQDSPTPCQNLLQHYQVLPQETNQSIKGLMIIACTDELLIGTFVSLLISLMFKNFTDH